MQRAVGRRHPANVLQFVPTSDDATGQASGDRRPRERGDPDRGLRHRRGCSKAGSPSCVCYAETSGKNSMIISAMADHDQAIKDLVKSAFGHAGQKCSAASLAVLEAEVYDNPAFLRQLRDAAESLTVGPAWDPAQLGHTADPRAWAGAGARADLLDAGESWLLEPRMVDGNPQLWSPGIKLGVARGSLVSSHRVFWSGAWVDARARYSRGDRNRQRQRVWADQRTAEPG